MLNNGELLNFQEVDNQGRAVTVRRRVDERGQPLVRSAENKRSHKAARQSVRRPGQYEKEYAAELAAKNAAAKAKRASVKAAKPLKGGRNQEQEQEQNGGRAVSLKTAVRLLRSYYNNKYNKN